MKKLFRIKLKIAVIWRVIWSDKFIFFNIKHTDDQKADVFKCHIGISKKQDIARFLKNEASKLTWGHLHTDIKNLKV